MPAQDKCRINFAFREKLNAISEGFRHDYCYQCGACVADCPACNYSETFNPRLILLRTILGFEDELIGPDSVIWECTNCYTCSERCPQDVRPVDVIIALKNLCVKEGQAPSLVGKITDVVFESGLTTKITPLVGRRREELDLPPLRDCPVDEIKGIIDNV